VRWLAKDGALYVESKSYIDTLFVPLVSVSFGEKVKKSGNDYEFLQLITTHLERQFQGRILLLPTVIYPEELSDSYKKILAEELFQRFPEEDFQHRFFISTTVDLKDEVEKNGGIFIFLPSIPLEHIDGPNRLSIIENQVRQLSPLVVDRWQEVERRKNT